jgi:hypothetical protein
MWVLVDKKSVRQYNTYIYSNSAVYNTKGLKMQKLNKTQINILIARAETGITDLTVIKQHLDAGNVDAAKHFAEHWIKSYTENIQQLKNTATFLNITL